MNNRPHGNELLAIARRTLLDELLPLIPADRKYDALMVANAMAIAAREFERQNSADREAADAIAAFYRDIGMDESVVPSEQSLADRIRDGQIEKKASRKLYELLVALTRMKLAVSNPKYLDQ